MDARDGVVARIGVDHATENRRLRDELARAEAENAGLRASLDEANQMLDRHHKMLDDATVVWQCPRLGMPEKLLWFGLAMTGLQERSSVICQQLGALGSHYAGSQRSGTRALEGDKNDPRGSLKGEGLVGEVDRTRNVVTLELRDVPTALKARIARGSDGQQRVFFETDAVSENDLFAKPESRSVPSAVVRDPGSAVLAPKSPTPSNINIDPGPSGYMNIEDLSVFHANVPVVGGNGAKSAEVKPPTEMGGLLADCLANLVDQLMDEPGRLEKAAALAPQIVAAVADPAFEDLEHFAGLLAHAVCVDCDFPQARLWRILKDLGRGETAKGGKITNRGAWFRNAIRAQAAEAIAKREGDAGDAIKDLLVRRRPK